MTIDPDSFFNFPNRPDTPSFWELSKAVLANDAESTEDGRDLDTILGTWGIDGGSAMYVAVQRSLRLKAHVQMNIREQAVVISAWIDGLATGLRVAQDRAKDG